MEKFREKKFHSTFRGLCSWSVLIFLSRHPLFTTPVPSRSVFPYPLWIVSQSDFFSKFLHSCFRKEWRDGKEWFLKCLKRSASFLRPFFYKSSLHQSLLYPDPFSLCLDLIWMGGLFRPMKFESRPERKPGDDESCFSFLSNVEEQRT